MSTVAAIPQFVHEDPALIIAEMKTDLEQRTNHSFAPADVEMLLINGFAYREMLLRGNINDTARQNLVAFARGPMLDYLAALVGVTRLPPSGAATELTFTLVTGHGGVTIPQGMRVQSVDGKVIFTTTSEKFAPSDTFLLKLIAVATPGGAIGNGYAPGTVATILDPVAFVSAVTNLSITAGGSDEESDEELRERIKLAPSSFSVAGPTGAYKFFAKSASPLIVDVAVTIGHETFAPYDVIPGQVDIFPLLAAGGIPGAPILDAVNAICNDEKVRPLTDTVNVQAPTNNDFTIQAQLIKLPDADTADIEAAVATALEAYKNYRLNHLGVDAVRSQIIALCMVPGVYDVVLIEPAIDVEADPNEFANCTAITATVTGVHDE